MEAVVVDAGSKLLKAGFAVPDHPPSMVISTQMKQVPEDDSLADPFLFENKTVDPVVRGFVNDWDAMEDLLKHVFYTGLGWEMGNEGQVLFTDPLATPKAIREQLVQMMFENFNISGFYASEQAVLSLYAVGRISGCTVDIGHGKTDIASVIEGAVQHISSRRFEIGGMDLTNLFAQELGKSNPLVNLSISECEKLKEHYACCAEDAASYDRFQHDCPEEQHTLPDGQVIKIGRGRYTVGEALFQPSILNLEGHGIVEQLVRCVSTVSSENHRQLLDNTVLCGGSTSMIGFEDRFQKEAGLCSSAIRPCLVKVFERISLKKDIGPTDEILIWLKEFSLSLQPNSSDQVCDDHEGVNSISNNLPIWEAAQKAVSRYEAVLSAFGPRERLLRKFFILLGLVPSKPMQAFDLDSKSTCESHLSDSFLPRITLSDIWKPATLKNCGNDIWKMLRTSASILVSESILQEPAFQQIILLYMEEIVDRERVNQAEVPSLQMKIYEEIPIPDLQVIFPHKKLSFRILDSVRLDAATILGLLAYFLSYKFEDILSSPSALLLDVIAASALVIYVTRVLLGYKQTRDRYHLLVNRTLYEKTAASGFGCIHFLLDASEQQQYKEAILVYAILLKMEGGQVTGMRAVGDECERFIYNVFREKVEMPVEKSIDTLVRLGLVTRETVDGQIRVQAVPCSRAHAILQKRWSSLIGCGD